MAEQKPRRSPKNTRLNASNLAVLAVEYCKACALHHLSTSFLSLLRVPQTIPQKPEEMYDMERVYRKYSVTFSQLETTEIYF